MGKIHSLSLTSQVWQGITWTHELDDLRADRARPTRTPSCSSSPAGSTGSKPDAKDHERAFALAKASGARVAVLPQVPNQPLLGDKNEDDPDRRDVRPLPRDQGRELAAALPDGQERVRAMDAVQAWAKEQGKAEVKRFVVTGASKRGWTTWLTGAVDQRVVAIAPMVIDTLNMKAQRAQPARGLGQAQRADRRLHQPRPDGASPRRPRAASSGRWSTPTPTATA